MLLIFTYISGFWAKMLYLELKKIVVHVLNILTFYFYDNDHKRYKF